MSYIQKIKEFIKSHKIISVIVAVAVLFLVYKVFGGGGTKHEVYTVKVGEVTQKVIVNGKTKPVNSVDLAFEVNGTVRSSNVKIGSRVYAGQAIVSLDQGTAYADLLQAQANLASEQARLDELKKGTRPEELVVAQTQVDNAQVSFNDAKRNFVDKVNDIINNKVDQLFSNPHTTSPKFNLVVNDAQLKNDIEFGRLQVESALQAISTNINNTDVAKIVTLVDNVAKAVNSQTSNSSLSQTTIDGYKADISTAKTTLNSAKESYNSALSALTLAQNNLSLKQSGSTPEAISAQNARVLQMDALVESAQAKLSKMTLRSPQNGIVTKQDAKVGEIVTPGKAVVSVISDSDLEIEASVSEISIGKVVVGNPVIIKFDAFPGQTFNGSVTYIEPAETVIDGVVNYKVTVAFSEKYPEIKSGLTTKLDIITGVKKDVLVIPQYALLTKGEGTFVSKQNGKEFVEVPVTVGLRGQDGNVEVVSGLSSGDTIDVVAPK